MFATPAFAQSAAGASGGAGALFASPLLPMILIFGIFWFFMIRPENQKRKAHQAKIAAVRKGDTAITGGGVMGKVTKVDNDTVEIEIASGVRVKALIAMLADVNPLAPAKPAND